METLLNQLKYLKQLIQAFNGIFGSVELSEFLQKFVYQLENSKDQQSLFIELSEQKSQMGYSLIFMSLLDKQIRWALKNQDVETSSIVVCSDSSIDQIVNLL